MLLAAWEGGDLVLAGVTEVTFGALPMHLGFGLPTHQGPKDGIFPCGRKRQSKDWQPGGGLRVYFIETLLFSLL